MNNSVNYGNFISLLIKNNDDELYDVTANPVNYMRNRNNSHLDVNHDSENITGLKIWLGE